MRLTKVLISALLGLSISANAIDEDKININFRDLNLRDFIEMISKITHKNILINVNLNGKINFVSQEPIKKSSLIPLANSILESKGFTIIDQGDFYKVVKASSAASQGLDVSSKVGGETMKTVMFPLKNTNAAIIRAKIKPLLGRNDKVISFKENNVLAITSTPRVLKSIAKVINTVEARGEKKSVVVRLKYSSVKDIFANAQNMAKKIFPQSIESQKVDVFQDLATNSIILIGKPENNARMIKYIKQLDIKGDSVEQKLYVIRLKNSNVEEMEKILSKLISQMNSLKADKIKTKGSKPKKAMVVADVERNALIILATSEQMKNIRDTIREIDIPKVQVYVKSKIVEIDTNMAEQIGLQYGLNGGAITSTGLFTLASNMGASALRISPQLLTFLNTNNKTTYTDSNGNVIEDNNPAFKFDETDKVFALGAQLDFLRRNGAAHILSEPSVLCTNNKLATIYVGQTMSILTKGQQSTQGQGNIINSYSREDIGITLKVKPRLSSNNKVSLEVETQIEDVDPSSEQIADRPTTTKRKVITNAIVNNGETIILGGLMKKVGGKGINKIPFLGDIPLLGELLFTHHSDVEREQNVVIYLTPYIVRKSGDLAKLKELLAELDEVQERYNHIVEKILEDKKKPFFSLGSDDDKAQTSSAVKPINSKVKANSGHLRNLELLDSLEEDY